MTMTNWESVGLVAVLHDEFEPWGVLVHVGIDGEHNRRIELSVVRTPRMTASEARELATALTQAATRLELAESSG